MIIIKFDLLQGSLVSLFLFILHVVDRQWRNVKGSAKMSSLGSKKSLLVHKLLKVNYEFDMAKKSK